MPRVGVPQVFREEGLIYMVLEYGDIDLARLLHNHEEAKRARAAAGLSVLPAPAGGAVGPPPPGGQGAATRGGAGGGELDENFVRLYWQQMLQVGGDERRGEESLQWAAQRSRLRSTSVVVVRCCARLQAVQGIHELRIVHSDLKPANFMLVQGQLKLIDFGIAKSIQGDTTSIARESQVLSQRPRAALMRLKRTQASSASSALPEPRGWPAAAATRGGGERRVPPWMCRWARSTT